MGVPVESAMYGQYDARPIQLQNITVVFRTDRITLLGDIGTCQELVQNRSVTGKQPGIERETSCFTSIDLPVIIDWISYSAVTKPVIKPDLNVNVTKT